MLSHDFLAELCFNRFESFKFHRLAVGLSSFRLIQMKGGFRGYGHF